MNRDICHDCDAPVATNDDLNRCDCEDGCDVCRPLCWRLFHSDECQRECIDWRQRALDAETEAQRLRTAVLAEANKLVSLANAVSFFPDGGARWAGRIDAVRGQIQTLVTAATPEVDATHGAARVDGFRPVGQVEQRSSTPTMPAERSALLSEVDRYRAALIAIAEHPNRDPESVIAPSPAAQAWHAAAHRACAEIARAALAVEGGGEEGER